MRGQGLGSTPANSVIVIGGVFPHMQGKENGLVLPLLTWMDVPVKNLLIITASNSNSTYILRWEAHTLKHAGHKI